MSSIFLSHTSCDKPFVEKLAVRLMKLGIKVWFDKWEIKTGDSITWKIEEGLKENEFLGIVLSPESLESEWVKSELSAAWFKQMDSKKIVILPIYLRNCDIPLLLRDKKYADFRTDFDEGLGTLAEVFGIKNTEIISLDNWRKFVGRNEKWKDFQNIEFSNLITVLTDLAVEYNWSTYVGGSSLPYSFVLSNNFHNNKCINLGIRLDGKTKSYLFTDEALHNPNNMKPNDFKTFIGNTINSCEEYVWRILQNYKINFGNPDSQTRHFDYKFPSNKEKEKNIKEFINKSRWYNGEKL